MVTFKDLWIWKEAHELMLEIHEMARKLPKSEYYRKRDQVERSSSSVPDNIAEGYASYHYNNKIRCMYTARSEAAETQNHIEALAGKQYVSREVADIWFNRYQKLIGGINSFINYICEKRQRDKIKGKGKK